MPTVRQTTSLGVQTENASIDATLSHTGIQAMMDFWVYHSLAGNMFQCKAGTITTPLVGDAPLTDTRAEMVVDALIGGTVLIASTNISFRLAAGTLFESAGKSVAGPSTAGTAFVALPLKFVTGARAATATCRVQAHACTVVTEAATTTRRHWAWSQPIAAGAWPTWYDYLPRVAPAISNVAHYYVQIAGTGTGPSYYSTIDFLDDPASALL